MFNHRVLKKIVKAGGNATIIDSQNSSLDQFVANLEEFSNYLNNYKSNDY